MAIYIEQITIWNVYTIFPKSFSKIKPTLNSAEEIFLNDKWLINSDYVASFYFTKRKAP